jgi:hypothetical protein
MHLSLVLYSSVVVTQYRLTIGSVGHLQLQPTRNYNSLTDLRTLKITTGHVKILSVIYLPVSLFSYYFQLGGGGGGRLLQLPCSYPC